MRFHASERTVGLVGLIGAVLGLALGPALAPAQEDAQAKAQAKNQAKAQTQSRSADTPRAVESPKSPARVLKLKEPSESRVYQRDQNGRADIAIAAADEFEGARLINASLFSPNISGPIPLVEGKLRGVPTGGPYSVQAVFEVDGTQKQTLVNNVFVGDLWILAGQSNMEGVGDLVDVTRPDPNVLLLGMDGAWSVAQEPLHWLVDSPDPVHSGNPADRARRSAEQHRTRGKGAGLGLPFAVALFQATGVPIGLVATAHGGTSMEQWSPAKKGEGGNSLYGSFLRQVKRAGGKARGLLWYQGESDAQPDRAQVYPKVFADFIAAVRSDLGQPDLPFYYVQIGRFIRDNDPKPWNAVQDAQRTLVDRVHDTAVVSVIDLELDDLIHVGTQGLKRTGQRLARIAQRELFGLPGATTPTLDRVNRGANNTLVLRFKGVNIAASGVANPPGGFNGMMRGPSPVPGVGGGATVGLKPQRHIAGFSIRKEDGTPIPLIFEAAVGTANDTVVLKLFGAIPPGAQLWYGHGLDPYCNLVDALDMAVPVFGPIPLDDVK